MKARMRVAGGILAFAFLEMFSFQARTGAQGGGGTRQSGPVISGKVYAFERIADGVYYTTSSSLMATGGNHTIIVGDRDVFLVDAGATAAAGRALLEAMKLVN